MPQALQGTFHPARALVHHVGIDHRRLDARVAEQFLDGADVVSVLEQVRRERVPQCMAAHVLCDPGRAGRLLDPANEIVLVDVMAPDGAGVGIDRALVRRKDELPRPLVRRAGVLRVQRIGQLDVAESPGKIPLVKELRALEMFLEKRNDRGRVASGPPLTVNNVRFRLTLYVFAV